MWASPKSSARAEDKAPAAAKKPSAAKSATTAAKTTPRDEKTAAPEAAKTTTAPNWPKDPDVAERRKIRQAAKGRDKSKEWNVVLTPSEMAAGTARAKTATSSPQPGDPGFSGGAGLGTILNPSQLGFKGFGWNTIFGGDKPEETRFENEPARESLTQPPSGYQTPSPSYAYGIGATDNTKQRAGNWQDQNPANQKF